MLLQNVGHLYPALGAENYGNRSSRPLSVMVGNYRATSGATPSPEGPWGPEFDTRYTNRLNFKKGTRFWTPPWDLSLRTGTNSLFFLQQSVFSVCLLHFLQTFWRWILLSRIIYWDYTMHNKPNNNQIETINIPVRLVLYFSSHLASDLLLPA